jgi:ATP-dependent RNA helicase DeaD
VPSPEALRAKRMQTTVESLRDAIGVVADDHADVDEVLAELLSSHSIEDIARAAVKLAHDAEISALDESDIPDLSHTMSRDGKKSKKDFSDRPGRTKTFDRSGGQRNERLDGRDLARLYVSVGRRAGVRPGDLVGAIANESGVPGRDIGVRIFDSHSVVEVPAARAEHVIRAMKQTSIRGKRAMVRLYRDER